MDSILSYGRFFVSLTILFFVNHFAFASICDRSQGVYQAIEAELGKKCSEITEQNLSDVQTLIMETSAVTSHDFDGLTNLSFLALTLSNVKEVPPCLFCGLSNLEVLYLDSTGPLDHFDETGVQSLNKLTDLTLQIPELTLPGHFLSQNLNLVSLEISGGNLTDVDSDFFKGLTRLQSVYLYNSKITHLPVGLFRDQNELTVLDLSNNALQGVEMEALPRPDKLVGFIFDWEGIPTAYVHSLKNILGLGILTSRMNLIPPGSFASLDKLVLLSFQATSQDPLDAVHEDLLMGANQLQKFSLVGMATETLPLNLVRRNKALQQVILINNGLSYLPKGFFGEMFQFDQSTHSAVFLGKNNFSSSEQIRIRNEIPEAVEVVF